MSSSHTCPICRQSTAWTDNPFRPFCSKRCRDVDLVGWIDGSYVIPGRSLIDHTEEDLPSVPVHVKPPQGSPPAPPAVANDNRPDSEQTLPRLRLLRTERSDPSR